MKVDKEIILSLLESALSANYTGVRRIGNLLAKQLLEERDIEGAKAVQALMKKRGVPLQASGYAEALPRDASSRLPLIEESEWPSVPVFLNHDIGQVITQFLEDARNIDLLIQKGISSRLGLLIHGQPGTGKTLLAGHIAASLNRPFFIARLDSLISSRLGETSKNIRGIFEFIPSKNAILFLDEMDAIAKLRDDRHELGELKRVVNTVLQGLDTLPNEVIVIGATNHHHLLDPAIWRRFPYKINLGLPEIDVRKSMWLHFLFEENESRIEDAQILARVSEALSGADIENISLAARRRSVLSKSEISLAHILLAVTQSKTGNLKFPESGEMSSEDKRKLARFLSTIPEVTVTDISRVIGVSRQMAHRYLKESENGG
jgi:SpoVK/Ycf46/Vps4 family AAA+-type ATPase